jgi:hypothetical protein
VSLFLSKQLSIALCPTAVAGIAYVGRWRPREIDRQEFYFEDRGLDNALTGLSEALKQWAKAGAMVRIAVSNRYVRTVLLPWAGARLTAQESLILAQQHFREHYGDMDGWDIRIDRNQDYATAAIAFAIPSQLVTEVERLCRHHKLICAGITPAAVISWNRHAFGHAAETLLHAVWEAERLCLVATQKINGTRQPVAIRLLDLATEAAPFESLQQTLKREILLQRLPTDTHTVIDGFGQLPSDRLGHVEVVMTNLDQSAAMEMAWAVRGR